MNPFRMALAVRPRRSSEIPPTSLDQQACNMQPARVFLGALGYFLITFPLAYDEARLAAEWVLCGRDK